MNLCNGQKITIEVSVKSIICNNNSFSNEVNAVLVDKLGNEYKVSNIREHTLSIIKKGFTKISARVKNNKEGLLSSVKAV